ncbi:hypothetical protein KKF92_02765 [Patescibacteria group bacterium]|nr:hypothetical protein [Patescibacteria group bacterium]
MKFKLRKVVRYAYSLQDLAKKAGDEFFENINLHDFNESVQDEINAFFNEWLIFEFKSSQNQLIITKYFFENPDNLPESELKEIQQIIESQRYDFFEIIKVKRGEWIDTYGLTAGKKYKIYDFKGSISIAPKGVIPGRVAKVGQKWILVGCDTFLLPISYTNRAKKMLFQDNQQSNMSCKHALELYLALQNNQSQATIYTKKQIKNKRKEIKRKYQKLTQKYKCSVPFAVLEKFIYQENYQNNFADSLTDMMALGLPLNMVKQETALLSDLWNSFPHKILDDKCPIELYQNAYLNT